MLGTIVRDLRWAVRHAARRPAVSAAVVGTLTLGIAATTIAYGLATSVLWRPLPFKDADRLVFVWEAADGGPRDLFRVTSGRFAEWRERAQSFSSLALFAAVGFALDTGDGVTPVRGVRVSPAFFETLGVTPALGRTFRSADEVPGQQQVVVLSDRFWRDRLGQRPDVVGMTLRLGGASYTVVGVMPPVVFPGWPSNPANVSVDPSQRELWVPIVRTPQFDSNTRSHVFGVVARLAPGVSPDGGDGRAGATGGAVISRSARRRREHPDVNSFATHGCRCWRSSVRLRRSCSSHAPISLRFRSPHSRVAAASSSCGRRSARAPVRLVSTTGCRIVAARRDGRRRRCRGCPIMCSLDLPELCQRRCRS